MKAKSACRFLAVLSLVLSTAAACSEPGSDSMDLGPLPDGPAAMPDMATTPLLMSGTGYGLVFSAAPMPNIDARPSVEATFDSAGSFVAYKAHAMEQLALGSATNAATSTDGIAAWGVWRGGPTTGVWYVAKPNGDFSFDPITGGFHYAIGKTTPDAALPASGSVPYTLVSGTPPARTNATALGTLRAISLTIDFSTRSGTFSITAAMPDGDAVLSGALSYVGSNGKILSFGSTAGDARGIFVGASGERVVLSYTISHNGGVVHGAATLKR